MDTEMSEELDKLRKELEESQRDNEKAKLMIMEMKSLEETKTTELHSVIAQLRKQLGCCDNKIDEDDEEQEWFEDGLFEVNNNLAADEEHEDEEHDDEQWDNTAGAGDSNNAGGNATAANTLAAEYKHQTDLLSQIRSEHSLIRSQLVRTHNELKSTQSTVRSLMQENSSLKKKLVVALSKSKPLSPSSPQPSPKLYPPSNVKHARVLPLKQTMTVESLYTDLQNSATLNSASDSQLASELEILETKYNSLKSQNNLLKENFNRVRNRNEKLTCLLGQYESEVTVLKMKENNCDNCIEGYDVLVALLESELGQLLACFRAVGNNTSDNCDNIEFLLERANKNRLTAENAARKLIGQEDSNSSDSGGSYNSNCTPPPILKKKISPESQIRSYIIKLKTQKQSLQSILTSPILNLEEEAKLPKSEAMRYDLETAVLMQELMALREENLNLRRNMRLEIKSKLSNANSN